MFFLFVSAMFSLVSCAVPSTAQTNPHRGVTPSAIASQALQQQTATQPVTQQLQTLPDAGGDHLNAQTSSPTPVPPTAKSVQPTVTPTEMPVLKSPTPTQEFAPDLPTQLIIPAIDLDAPIVAVGWSVVEENGQQVSEWEVPGQRVVGWLNSSALVGARGNTVLVGHQNVEGRVFENLEYLRPGAEIYVQTGAQSRKYVVATRLILLDKDQPLEVRRENGRWIGPSNDERLTLVTCWPRNDNTHRLILVALPAP